MYKAGSSTLAAIPWKRKTAFVLILTGLVLSSIFGLSSCAMIKKSVKRPEVKFDRIDLKSISFSGIETAILLNMTNPNWFDLHIDRFEYAVSIDGKRVVSGNQEKSTNVPAGETGQLSVPVSLAFRDILSTAGAFASNAVERGEVPFILEGKITLAPSVLPSITVPFRVEKALPLISAPEISLESVTLRSLGFRGARLVMRLKMDNKNGTAIQLDNLDIDVELGGHSVANLTLQESDISWDSPSSRTLEIPVSLSFAQIARGIRAILESDVSPYRLSGRATFSSKLYGLLPLEIDSGGRVNISK